MDIIASTKQNLSLEWLISWSLPKLTFFFYQNLPKLTLHCIETQTFNTKANQTSPIQNQEISKPEHASPLDKSTDSLT